MANIAGDNSGSGQSNSASQVNDEKQAIAYGKPVRRKPPTVEEALDTELSAAAALMRLAVEWRAACQSRIARKGAAVRKSIDHREGGKQESSTALELSALVEMPEFRQYRKAIAEFNAAVRRTDVGREAAQQKS